MGLLNPEGTKSKRLQGKRGQALRLDPITGTEDPPDAGQAER